MFWPTQTKLKGLTPAIGASPNFVLPQKVLSDSNIFLCYWACCPFLGFNGFADNKKFINFGNQTNPQHQP